MAGDLVVSTINGVAIGTKNVIINGNFNINQRAVSGTVTLAAGAYGHDRFKAGASGCTYTFATVENVTTITISAGSLIQVIEGLNLQTGTYTLSWSGTAQGKIGGGSYSATGVTGSATGGTNLNVEFNTGTLSLVQLEKGSTATSFDYRPYGTELALCQRYFELISSASGYLTTSRIDCLQRYSVQKRAAATMALQGTAANMKVSNTGADLTVSGLGGQYGSNIDGSMFYMTLTSSGTTGQGAGIYVPTASAGTVYVSASSEL